VPPAETAVQPASPEAEAGAAEAEALEPPEFGGPLAGLFPVDAGAARAAVDNLLDRLAGLTGSGDGEGASSLAPWLLLTGALAWELIVLPRALRAAARQTVGPCPLLPEEQA
jgi:hypothetical protein